MIIDENGIEHYGCIYLIKAINSNLTTDGIYVGQTINFNKRKNCHWRAADDDNMPIQKAIKKYININFEMFIIEYCDSLDELNDSEEYYIAYYKSIGARLYNIKKGGDNHKMSEETKEKLRIAKTGKPILAQHGKTLSKEHREKIGNGNRGKIMSKKAREKIGNASRGRKYSDEIKQKWSDCSSSKKAIISIDEYGNTLNFESLTKAAKELNISYVGIKKVLAKKQFVIASYTFIHYKFSNIINNINETEVLAIDKVGNIKSFINVKNAHEVLNINYSLMFSALYMPELNQSKIVDKYFFISKNDFENNKKNIDEILLTFIDKNAKPIISVDKFGNEQIFESIAEAGRVLKISSGNIGSVLRNERKLASGYYFKLA